MIVNDEHIDFKRLYWNSNKEIGELYKSDFEMVYRLTKYLGKTWPDLYTE